ncbi:unnamed protein product [Allacma fusca]|uniref:EGF-like domain-containing protein n=1 Tax=Allacma fusca TaxID=39272 RepID=A0A8J2KQE5_9HEXA|nr:unnamed protein product [Allacma fusca]
MSTEFDYPSIALINDKLWENGIHAIFATPNTSLYTGLSSHVEGSSTVPLSKNQSGSIVEVVIQELQKIIDTVEIAEEQADTYRIRYYSKCHSSAEFVAGGKCNITGEASEDEHIIEYQIEIEVLKCPSRGAGPEESIEIGPIGFFSKLKIHLTPACSCSCETQPDVGQSPEFCLNGRSKCGQCDCSEGYCGKRCDKLLSNTTHAQCYRNELECSGNGTCHCGECYCQNEFMGSLCQFNRIQCPLGDDGRICSGRGICTTQFLNESMNIGSTNENEIIFCRCHPGFTGATCNCTSDTSNCRATPESSICSNNGDCKCNNCECRRGLQGKFCDECILADFEEKLSINPEFRTCMNTKFSDSKEAFSDISLLPCFSKHFPMPPIIRIVDDIPDSNCNRSMSPCRLEEYRHPTTDCKHQFSVNCNPENISVVIIQWNQYGTECSGPKDLMGLFVGVATAIVIAGIVALIAWKIATHYYDKQEFLKFEKERANAQWPTENNPLYIATTTMHMNPSYGTDPEELGECETQE